MSILDRQIADLDDRMRRLDRIVQYLDMLKAINQGDPHRALALALRRDER